MLYKLTELPHDEHIENQDYYDKLAPFNVCPPGWKPLTEKEFVSKRFGIPEYIEYRQVRLYKDGSAPPKDEFNLALRSVQLYWMNRWSGYAISTDYWGGKVHYFEFGFSKEEIESLIKKEIPNIIDDTSWDMTDNSRPNYGIRHYSRTIAFEQELTEKELDNVKEWLTLVKCPGWTGVYARNVGKNTYVFTTTYDSSD